MPYVKESKGEGKDAPQFHINAVKSIDNNQNL